MVEQKIAEEWHVPINAHTITLRQALEDMSEFRLDPSDVPFIIKLIENPRYNLLGLFPGRTNLHTHDCIHVLLGRGVLVKDEAFVIGFTMGSSHRMTTFKEGIFLLCSRYLYPEGYSFSKEDANVFRRGVQLAQAHPPLHLARIDFEEYLDMPVEDMRHKIGLDCSLIRSYYKEEKKRYTGEKECQRLL